MPLIALPLHVCGSQSLLARSGSWKHYISQHDAVIERVTFLEGFGEKGRNRSLDRSRLRLSIPFDRESSSEPDDSEYA